MVPRKLRSDILKKVNGTLKLGSDISKIVNGTLKLGNYINIIVNFILTAVNTTLHRVSGAFNTVNDA